jgi:3-hydroxyacyl-CoA dehydrogenase
MTDGTVSVAIIGTGDIGRGWAALCVAAGWPVVLYDNEANAIQDAQPEVEDRAWRLVTLERAVFEDTERGVQSMRTAPSLLQACVDAQWII